MQGWLFPIPTEMLMFGEIMDDKDVKEAALKQAQVF